MGLRLGSDEVVKDLTGVSGVDRLVLVLRSFSTVFVKKHASANAVAGRADSSACGTCATQGRLAFSRQVHVQAPLVSHTRLSCR